MEHFFIIKAVDGNKNFYKPLESFGTYHFIVKYQLSKKHLKLLGEYFNSLSDTKIK